jgi:uncharacterized protein YoxC
MNENMSSGVNTGVVISSESVNKLGKDIRTKTEELLAMIRTAEEKLNSSVSYYSSQSATEFRSKMQNFTEKAEGESKKTLESVATFFEKVAQQYKVIDEEIISLESKYLSDDSNLFGTTE